MCYENSVFKNMTSFASVFHSVFWGSLGKEMMEKGRRIGGWIFVCVLMKRERNECVYLVLTVLSSP